MARVQEDGITGIGGEIMGNDDEGVVEVDESLLRRYVTEVIRKCGKKWCLYAKHARGGKHRRLGTHPSRASAARQERAIKAHGG